MTRDTSRHKCWAPSFAVGVACLLAPAPAAEPAAARVEVKRNAAPERLSVSIDGKEAFSFFHGPGVDLPYLVPLSPSGKELTVVRTDPYPHHRSVWFGDTVRLAGQRRASFYNAWYSRKDKKDPNSPFMDRVRCVKIDWKQPEGERRDDVTIDAKLLWEIDGRTAVLDESRRMRFIPLSADGREYLLDLTFTLTAAYGDVAFVSDAVHYAWPYVRMATAFSVDKGGTMTSSTGGVNQKATCDRTAWWIDYSHTVGGVTEGLALLVHPSGGGPPRWLTRDYGTFGPRRDDARSGKPFTLKKGDSISQRAAVLVHRGDVQAGKVAERCKAYAAAGK